MVENKGFLDKHYKHLKIEPLEYISVNEMDFISGNIIKYISRYKYKNGLDDLRKAKYYLEYLISKEEKALREQNNAF